MEYWESKFKKDGNLWQFKPSDSDLIALDLFKSAGFHNLLIPGFGYGRNAKLFYNNGFKITGIEISQSAIDLARENGLDCKIYHGSVTSMPFDDEQYHGIFCYALIHLLNKKERRTFIKACYHQLAPDGVMIFTVISKQSDMYGKGLRLSSDRFGVMKGLNVYFYDSDSVIKEFSDFGMTSFRDIDEPIKYMTGYDPVKCILVICRRMG